jgi:CheY-like chemotaxis protein
MLEQTFPKNIAFTEILVKDLPRIQADRSQIHQALLNLFVNARDAMPDGGSIKIEVEKQTKESVKERFSTADQDLYVRLSISDTGIGMDEETRMRAFDPFFTTKEKSKGTGLGLAVVYGILQAHRGFVEVNSALRQGTTFRLYFPAEIGQEKELLVKTEIDFKLLEGKENILIVEDEPKLLDTLQSAIISYGYTVLVASDGESALSIFDEHKTEIDLVLLDQGLPKLLGDQVFKYLKKANPQIKVIFMSGFIDLDMKEELLKHGVKLFMQKPFSYQELLVGIRNVLDNQ